MFFIQGEFKPEAHCMIFTKDFIAAGMNYEKTLLIQ
jgi:hypothetical protein